MEWKISPGLVPYDDALAAMTERVSAIQQGTAGELVWLLEHPPLYTLGTSAKATDVIGNDLPTYETGRGGQVTYHGPGQRIAYVLRDLKKHAGSSGPDLRAYVQDLEQWLIDTLAEFGITSFTREGRVGVWVSTNGSNEPSVALRASREAAGVSEAKGAKSPLQLSNTEAKIAALGVRVQKWVTSHGVALNVSPDLAHYAGIVPCGIREFGVTSMRQMGVNASMSEVDAVLRKTFDNVFSD